MPRVTKEEQIELAWAQHLAWAAGPPMRLMVLSAVLREQLAEQQNWRCCYCGLRMDGVGKDWDAPTFEHVVPSSKGGSDDVDNVVTACRRCNERRGDTPGEAP